MHASLDSTRPDAAKALYRSPAPTHLRALLGFDAATCVPFGTLLVAANAAVPRVTGLPPGLLADCGWLLLAFGAVVAATALRRAKSRVAVLAIVDANVAWTFAQHRVRRLRRKRRDTVRPCGRRRTGVAVGVIAVAEFALWRRAFRRPPAVDRAANKPPGLRRVSGFVGHGVQPIS